MKYFAVRFNWCMYIAILLCSSLYAQKPLIGSGVKQNTTNSNSNPEKRLRGARNLFFDTTKMIKPLNVLQRSSEPEILKESDWISADNSFPSKSIIFYGSSGNAVWANTYCSHVCVKNAQLRIAFHAGGSSHTYEPQSTNLNYTWNAICTLTVTGYYRSGATPITLYGPQEVNINQDSPELVMVKDITSIAPAASIDNYCGVPDELERIELTVSLPTDPNNQMPWITTAPDQYSKVRVEMQYIEEQKVDLSDLELNNNTSDFWAGAKPILPGISTYATNSSGTPSTVVKEVHTNGSLVHLRWFDANTFSCSDSFPSYQLQIMKLYNIGDENLYDEKSIHAMIDWSKALTIETQSKIPEIKLTLAEGRGYYVWRVRPIGNAFEGGVANPSNWGPWSYTVNEGEFTIDPCNQNALATLGIVSGKNNDAIFFYTGLDEDKNWSYSRTFKEANAIGPRTAEEIVYVDGLLNPKQTQARIASKDSILVTEMVYDYSGRSSIKTLPVPLSQVGLQHRESLLLDANGNLFSQQNIDHPDDFTSLKNKQPEAVSTTGSSLLSAYYSNNNPNLNIPNADGYPYSASRAGSDGRMRETSANGYDMRLGSDKTTKLFYSGVADMELTSILGDEAPSSKSVTKTVTKDPNGIFSAAYTSKEGKTIATCLLADASLGAVLQTASNSKSYIGSYGEANGNPLQYLLGDTVNTLNITDIVSSQEFSRRTDAGESMVAKEYFFAKPTTLTLSYAITPNSFKVRKQGPNCNDYCAICDFDVLVRVVNTETQEVVNNSEKVLNNNTLQDIVPGVCTAEEVPIASWQVQIPEAGTYSVQRILRTKLPYPANTAADPNKPAQPRTWEEQHVQSALGEYMISGWDKVPPANATPDYTTSPIDEIIRCVFKLNEIESEISQHLNDVNPATRRSWMELNNPYRKAELMLRKYRTWFSCENKTKTFSLSPNPPCSSSENSCRTITLTDRKCSESEDEETHADYCPDCGGTEQMDFERYLVKQIYPIIFPDLNAQTVSYNLDEFLRQKNGIPKRSLLQYIPGDMNTPPRWDWVPQITQTTGWFNTMVSHMRAESNGQCSLYTCKKLWKAWMSVVQEYKAALEVTRTISGQETIPHVEIGVERGENGKHNLRAVTLDLYDMFLEKVGRFGCQTSDNTDNYKTSNYGDYVRDGYKKIYTPNGSYSDQCTAAYSDDVLHNVALTERLQNLQRCQQDGIMQKDPTYDKVIRMMAQKAGVEYCDPPTDACLKDFYTSVSDRCFEECVKKRDVFRKKFIEFAAQRWQLYPAGTKRLNNTIIQEGDIDCLSEIRISCAVNSLFNDCEKNSKLSSPPTEDELQAVKQIMMGDPELEVKSQYSNLCPNTSYRDVSQSNPPGGMKLMDAMAQYLNEQWEKQYKLQEVNNSSEGAIIDFGAKACDFLTRNGLSNLPTCLCNNADLRLRVPRGPLATRPDFRIKDPRRDGSGAGCCGLVFTRELICGTPSSPHQYVVDVNTYMDKMWGISTRRTDFSEGDVVCGDGNKGDGISGVYNGLAYVNYKVSAYATSSTPNYEHSYYNDQTEVYPKPSGFMCTGMEGFLSYRHAMEWDLSVIRLGRIASNVTCPDAVPLFSHSSTCYNTTFKFEEMPLQDGNSLYYPQDACLSNANPSFAQYWTENRGVGNSMAFFALTNASFFKKITYSFPSENHGIIRMYGPIAILLPKLKSSDPQSLFYVELGRGPLNGNTLVNASLHRYAGTMSLLNGAYPLLNVVLDYNKLKTNLSKQTSVPFYGSGATAFDNLTSGSFTQKIGKFEENADGYLVYNDMVDGKKTRYEYIRFYTTETVELDCEQLPCPNTVVCDNLCVRYTIPEEPEQPPTIPAIAYEEFPDDCNTMTVASIVKDIETQFKTIKENISNSISLAYQNSCGADKTWKDQITVAYHDDFYHYTLYYYDRAGNLARTVPPRGVNIDPNRSRTTPLQGTGTGQWQHWLSTHYRYNSTNQLIYERTPDGGETWHAFNAKQQLRFSQTARQRAMNPPTCSYINYDALGRAIESGQCQIPWTVGANSEATFANMQSYSLNYTAAVTGTVTEVVRTTYGTSYASSLSLPVPHNSGGAKPAKQRNQRNRISKVVYDADGTADNDDDVATYYSYDNQGNTEWLIQQIPGLDGVKIDYDYDLISGNVNRIRYREGFTDQYYRRFEYDADNRLVASYSSADTIIWEQDARYEYYAHGPLRRVVIGEDTVQGTDYLYTINGWLKAINHPDAVNGTSTSDFDKDPGRDGKDLGAGKTIAAKDAFAMALSYYNGDYRRKYGTAQSAFNSTGATVNGSTYTQSGVHLGGTNLYNGNITAWTTKTQTAPATGLQHNGELTGETYRYDQLNRLLGSTFLHRFGADWDNLDDRYNTAYQYDESGNILSLSRNAYDNNGNLSLDELHYDYGTPSSISANGNKLQGITDNAPVAGYPTTTGDIGRTNTSVPITYTYNAEGNLVGDANEGLSITWNRFGKVKSVIKTESSKTTTIHYGYDATMNRVSKNVMVNYSGGLNTNTTTLYVHDAKGQQLAVYNASGLAGALMLKEVPLYGMKRLGMRNYPAEGEGSVQYCSTCLYSPDLQTGAIFARTVGWKSYELDDHLGNVRAVIGDIKRQDGNGSFVADLKSMSNYYPFGMQQPGRIFESDDYRYGFGGQMKDDEIYGSGNAYTAQFWEYDARIGRRWNPDPVSNPSESRYATFRSNPIAYNDPNGDCPDCKDGKYKVQKGDNFSSLEKKWGMKEGTLAGYNPGVDPKKLQIGSSINVSPTSSGNFKSGTGNPTISHDNGFAGFPKESPTPKDVADYLYWKAKAYLARILRPSLDDGVEAYLHYLDATGTDKNFSLQEFFDEDASGVTMRDNAIAAIKLASENLLPYAGERDISMSSPFFVTDGSVKYPYPVTENWQKAIGAFPFYMTGVVTAANVAGKLQYTLNLTIHAEDRYNFNPTQKDIATGTPDDVNGRFEVVGIAKQYMHYSTFTTTITWTK